MHALIINGSPRVKKLSNTDKILDKFEAGMAEKGATFTRCEVSDRKQWDDMRKAFGESKNILIAIPLYVENIPGLLIEFLETLTPKNDGTEIAFILQGGFAEGVQLRCGEAYLKILTEKLGCKYAGTLVKGDNFGIRFMDEKTVQKITGAYTDMGREYAECGNFFSEKCAKFTGPEIFPVHVRLLVGIIFKTLAKRGFKKAAKDWGCTKPLNYRPYK